MELCKLREACCDQLLPFEGLWEYAQSLDEYPGTIFRFPLRTAENTAGSTLIHGNKLLNETEARQLLETYFDEARISLLFLKQIKAVDFRVQGDPDSGWSITQLRPLDNGDDDLFTKSVTYEIVRRQSLGQCFTVKDRWWIAIEDLTPEFDRLPESSRRAMKNVECGLAALVQSNPDPNSSSTTIPKADQSRIFNSLPLPEKLSSDLPVHIHATFLLSGDRQSIAIEEHGMNPQEAEWNRYLLRECLPKLYLEFLESIGPQRQVRRRVYEFWPQQEPPKRSCAALLCAAFWEKLPQSTQRIFPKAQPLLEKSQRKAWEALDFNQAVFDFPLAKTQSDTLAPLLLAMQVNLARDIPKDISQRLKPLSGVKFVTGPMLRALLKSEKSRMFLQKEVAKNLQFQPLFEVLYDLMIPVKMEELQNLDGCHLLPLADRSLATLKYEDKPQPRKYFVATDEERKLFEFASNRMVLLTSGAGTGLGRILASKKFNLTKFKLSDAEKLLETKPAASKPNAADDEWLSDFWKYWNENIDATSLSTSIVKVSARIFQATLNDVPSYVSPAEFHHLPAVIEPANAAHQELCKKIPGLWRLDNKFLPKSLVVNEESFSSQASFYRLIRTLRQLSNEIGIDEFMKTHLSVNDLKVRL